MPIKTIEGLPYKQITEIAGRDIVRLNSTRGRETYFIDFKLLKIRDGFNLRKEYIQIPELASFIETNGLPEPLTVDMLKDGTCYIEQGHRRFKALEILKEKKVLKSLDLPGIKNGSVECFVNTRDVDELTRIKRQFSSNNGEKYTPLELGELCKRLHDVFGLTQERIGEELGMSRQNVKNMMIIAEQPDQIKQAIKHKDITATAAIDLSRKVKDSNKRNDIVQEAVSKGTKVTTTDVKRIIGDKDLKEIPPQGNVGSEWDANISNASTSIENNTNDKIEKDKNKKKEKDAADKFDVSREEIKLCQNVIKNVDRINTIVSKITNEQVKSDIDKLIGYIQKDMVEVRQYIHLNKKQ